MTIMNTATLGLPKPIGFHLTGPHPHLAALNKSRVQLGTKEILILFRALVFLVILVLLFFNEKNNQVLFQPKVQAFLAIFDFSILGMTLMRARWFENTNILSGLFIADILFITTGLFLSGIGDTDLFLIFFTTVFISALSQDVKSVFSVALVSCTLYGFLQYKTTGKFEVSDTVFMVRFPFLFVAAALSGYMAMETKKHQAEKVRLLDMNHFLADQADASTLKLMETNRKLKSLLEYHHCVLSSLKTGIIVTQNDGKVRTFNAGARDITGQVEAEMAEKTLDTFPEKLQPVANALRRTLAEGKSYIQDHLDLTTQRSEVVPVTLETSLLRAGNGSVIGAIATLRDMTLLRQMETQLVRSERFSALDRKSVV